GQNLRYVTALRGFGHTMAIGAGETCSFVVEACDIYGGTTLSEVVTVTSPDKENVPPKAVITPKELIGTVDTPITFSGMNSTDNDAIASYDWNFGDGEYVRAAVCTHSYAEAGTYTVKLTVTDESGNTNTDTRTVTIYDITAEDAEYALLKVTVRDDVRDNTPVIPGAKVMVTAVDGSFEVIGETAANGVASLVVPRDIDVVITAAASEYTARTIDRTICPDNTLGIYTCEIGLTPMNVSILDGSLTVKEMTLQEIIDAGIDVTAPENQHVVEFTVTMEFQVSPDIIAKRPVTAYINMVGDVLPTREPHGWDWDFDWEEDPDDDDDNSDNDDNVKWPDDLKIGVFPLSKEVYLVIYGQTHWLKEMFNVELLVANSSAMYNISDCVAQLELPEGLSLATMISEQQSEVINLGTLAPKASAKANWYVCGDEVGEYNLTAHVSGVRDGEPFAVDFTTDQPLKVYAGEALQLNIQADMFAAKGLMYPVQFELKNVSTKELYNVSLNIFGAAFQKKYHIEEVRYEGAGETWQWEEGMNLSAIVLKPGESLGGEFQIRFAEDLAKKETRYMLTDSLFSITEGSTTEIPINIELRDNTFFYPSQYVKGSDVMSAFFYDDDFFAESAETFNPELAYMSLCFEVTAFNSAYAPASGYDADIAGRNAHDLLVKLGFDADDIELRSRTAGYEGQPDDDSIAATIASKPWTDGEEEYTLIAVAVRGGGYEYEWHDNFLIGRNADHQGFSKAADNVLTAIDEYIAEHQITGKVKFWITGFSRAAATANLTAARIMDGVLQSAITFGKEDMYAYCFATPANTTSDAIRDERYSTIYSIINPADAVPMVAPAEWGYDRYGTNLYLPSAGVSSNYYEYEDLMRNAYAYVSNHKYTMDEFRTKTFIIIDDSSAEMMVSILVNNQFFLQEAFLQEFTEAVFNGSIGSVSNYRLLYEEALCDLIGILAGNEMESEALKKELTDVFDLYTVVDAILTESGRTALKVRLANVLVDYSKVSEHMELGFVAAYNLVCEIEDLLWDMIVNYKSYVYTLITNIDYIGQAHFPELYMAWMRLLQSESQFDKSCWYEVLDANRGYRKIHINCPVDVEIYDVSGTEPVLKARFVDGQPQVIEGSSMIAYVDDNGQMTAYLPYDSEYDIRIIATGDGQLNYSITEVDLTTGEKNRTNYYGIEITEGDQLTGFVADQTEANPEAYSLQGTDGQTIEPDEQLDNVEIIRHTVRITTEGEGVVMNSGSVVHGDFVKLEAHPTAGNLFLGWYMDDQLISE
ncbi:MAG: PKD domain-containing protein, partial [Clostridia bacterium]|nr:PKD domain-containing protein [Clostridia bacterium]